MDGVFRCPNCGYRITYMELSLVKCDYGCYWCNTSLSDFVLVKQLEEEKEEPEE